MAQLLVKIVARRETKNFATKKSYQGDSSTIASIDSGGLGVDSVSKSVGRKMFKKNGQVIDEVVEVINLPEFDASVKQVCEWGCSLDSEVKKQLRAYVTEISGKHHDCNDTSDSLTVSDHHFSSENLCRDLPRKSIPQL